MKCADSGAISISKKKNHVCLLTCGIDVEVGGFASNVANWLQARAFGSDLGGVSLGLVYIHLKGALWNLLASKQHGHLCGGHKAYKLNLN